MSKKQLLNESEIRRFMKLANLQPLAGNVLKETSHLDKTTTEAEDPMGMTPDASMEAPAGDMDMGGGDEVEVEMGDDVDPDKKQAFEAAVQALADAMGIEVELESQEEQDAEGGEEMHDLGDDDEDESESDEEESEDEEAEMQEAKEEDSEDKEEKKDEGKQLSEDELVETVLARVTARLVAEAKKKSKVKTKMMEKKKKKKEEEKAKKVQKEATEAKGGGPLLSQGKNKHDVYKGHADMTYAKGEKGGKGGHELETVTAKAEHSVTHGGKNLATLGGNKK